MTTVDFSTHLEGITQTNFELCLFFILNMICV